MRLDRTARAKANSGNIFGDEYPQRLSELKNEFDKAQKAFDRSMQLEVFKGTVENGEHV